LLNAAAHLTFDFLFPFCEFLILLGFASPCRRKKQAREVHENSRIAQRYHGIRAKLHNQKRFKEKAAMKKMYVCVCDGQAGLTGRRFDASTPTFTFAC
jgi:hypothetical protein